MPPPKKLWGFVNSYSTQYASGFSTYRLWHTLKNFYLHFFDNFEIFLIFGFFCENRVFCWLSLFWGDVSILRALLWVGGSIKIVENYNLTYADRNVYFGLTRDWKKDESIIIFINIIFCWHKTDTNASIYFILFIKEQW